MTTAISPPAASRSHLQESLFAWLDPDTAPRTETKTFEESDPAGPPAPTVAEEKPQPPDLSHVWVVAAEIEVTPRIASIADYRGSFKTDVGQRVEALEVYCRGCRRPYDEVRGEDCSAKIDNRHLIGGDQSVRAKRKIPTPPKNARVIPGGTIQRRGISAYVAGVSRPR